MKKIFTSFLQFSRKDRIGILALITLIGIVLFWQQFLSATSAISHPVVDSSWVIAARQLEVQPPDSGETASEQHPSAARPRNSSAPVVVRRLFEFDPNTASPNDWQALGIRDKTIQTISRFMAKGGRFREPADLQKIYGMRKEDLDALTPFVRINTANRTEHTNPLYDHRSLPRSLAIADLNAADSSQLIALPGIGNKLALRIINFRDRLGGFHSVQQVAETYGLSDSTFQKIKGLLNVNAASVRKIHINTVTLEVLQTHPYFRYALAKPIIRYREEHGNFKSIEELKQVAVISSVDLQKIIPYIDFE